MAQLVARLVRNEKVGGSNPPSSTTGRHPIRMSVFCMPGRVGVVPVVVLLVAPLVFRALRCDALWGPAAVCAGGRRPAREIATREPAARSGRSRGPPWPCRHPPAPRLGPVTAHGHHSLTPPPTGTAAGPHRRPRAPQPGSAAPTGTAVPSVPSGALHSRLLSLTGGAGNSRETVITVAGVCFASGETDDTIASQIHLFLVLFHRAKASWVSWRRPDVSALVPTVSSRGAVSSIGVTKFAQRRLSMAVAPNHSPSAGKMAQNGRL